jgi:hypothetical protein
MAAIPLRGEDDQESARRFGRRRGHESETKKVPAVNATVRDAMTRRVVSVREDA